MVKKRNRRTRKKYKKRGGASDAVMKACNIRLKEQGVGIAKRGNMCIESDGKAGLKKVEEPAPEPIVQPVAQQVSQEPKQPSGVETVIAPLEIKESSNPNIKDRASALEKQFGETGMRKTRKALKTTVGSCRAAVDKNGNKYYYNESNETTYAAPETEDFNKICNPTDGIEKTGNKSGNCIGARYKGGEEYWYHPKKQFSTHDKNHPLCHEKEEVKAEDIKLPEEPNLSLVRLIETPKTKKKRKKRKKKRRTAKSHQRAASERNRRRQMKENEARKKNQSGGKRRTKRKKSRKRRR